MTIRVRANYEGWFRGMAKAFIQGGSSAFRATLVAAVAVPDQVNVQHPWMLTKVACIAFLIRGVMQLSEFLEKEPVPEMVTSDDGNA